MIIHFLRWLKIAVLIKMITRATSCFKSLKGNIGLPAKDVEYMLSRASRNNCRYIIVDTSYCTSQIVNQTDYTSAHTDTSFYTQQNNSWTNHSQSGLSLTLQHLAYVDKVYSIGCLAASPTRRIDQHRLMYFKDLTLKIDK